MCYGARQVALLAGLALVVSAIGAGAAEGARPRIGLALSGGGARGAAHIGVLKVLEELRVPIDCVAGTSFGAIVGGAFAAGATPEKLEHVLRSTDWDQVLSDRPPRGELSSRRKEQDYKALFDAEFGVKDGALRVPKGLLAGVSIESFLRELTSSTAVSDFQRLPIPFRAVATDIANGEPVVLDHGSVAKAMRASMAFPGFVAPVEIDGRLLVDGGVSNNLPIDVVRNMCADVVIAVDISTPPLDRSQIESGLSVVAQIMNFLGKATVDRQLASLGPGDVLLSPPLGDIGAGSFNRSVEAMAIGEAAARRISESLARYSVGETQYAEHRRRQIAASERGIEPVDEIRIIGLQRTNPEVLAALVRARPDAPLDEATIVGDLRRIYGRGDFESVDYRIVQEPGRRVMLIEPVEKSWGPDYVRFGLSLATNFTSGSVFNALASYRRTWLNHLGAEWTLEGQVGRDNYLFTELYQPLNARGVVFTAPYAQIGSSLRSLFAGEDRIATYTVRDTRVGLDVGAVLGTWGETRLGLLARNVTPQVETGPRLLPENQTNASGYRFKLFSDRYDERYFPRAGYALGGSLYGASPAIGADQSYRRGEATGGFAFSRGAHTLWTTVSLGSDFGTGVPPYDGFTLGGPLRMSGYGIDELQGRSFGFARAMYYNRTVTFPGLFGSGVFVGGSLEAGTVGRPFIPGTPTGTLWSGSAFVTAITALGPGFLGVGFAQGGRVTAYLLLGPP